MNHHKQRQATAFRQYELQAIMAEGQLRPTWFELLHRPQGMNQGVEQYFNDMPEDQKVAFDIELFRHLPLIQQRHWPHKLSINIHPVTLSDPDFLSLFDHMLSSQHVISSKLCIEVVETGSLPELSDHSITCLRHFKSLGGQLALDDFGTGNTHWQLIHNNLIDIIKIAAHKHFGSCKKAMLDALSNFAKSLQLSMVIEGVESEEDLKQAKSLGAGYFQGWIYDQWKLTS